MTTTSMRTCLGGIMAMSVLAAGCTDLKPLQAQVDALKSEVSRLSADTAANKSAMDANSASMRDASQAAAAAQTAANQAISAAQENKACCDATNEKLDRVFKRSISK